MFLGGAGNVDKNGRGEKTQAYKEKEKVTWACGRASDETSPDGKTMRGTWGGVGAIASLKSMSKVLAM